MILQVPRLISFRGVVVEAVAATANLTLPEAELHSERARLFGEWVMRAVGEAFEKIVVHGCESGCSAVVRLAIDVKLGQLRLQIEDTILAFAPKDVSPVAPASPPPALPEADAPPLIKIA
jgi:hypothetical protein